MADEEGVGTEAAILEAAKAQGLMDDQTREFIRLAASTEPLHPDLVPYLEETSIGPYELVRVATDDTEYGFTAAAVVKGSKGKEYLVNIDQIVVVREG